MKAGEVKKGLVYAGRNSETNTSIYVVAEDAEGLMDAFEAVAYAANYSDGEHPAGSFRLPTNSEMKAIKENAKEIGGFIMDPNLESAWYRSSSGCEGNPFYTICHHFGNKVESYSDKQNKTSVRLVLK